MAATPDAAAPRSAIVTMELQRGVVGDRATIGELAAAADEVGLLDRADALLRAAREAHVPVVHCTASWRVDGRGTPLNSPLTRSLSKVPGHLLEGTPAVEIDPRLVTAPTDLVINRHHGVSPFSGTSLDALLRSLGVVEVIVCGVSLNVGVVGTVIEAVNLGWNVTVATDATVGVPVSYGREVIEHTLRPLARCRTVTEIAADWPMSDEHRP